MFALAVAGFGCAAFADIYVHGTLSVVNPMALSAVAVIGVFFLLISLVTTRQHAISSRRPYRSSDQLTSELESVISALESTNTRLNASEARYKGLVDAQGDAILRRTPDGRLTYANEAFFRLFRSRRPAASSARPGGPSRIPIPRRRCSGVLPVAKPGRERVSYDQHIKTIAGYRWIAWEDYAIRDTEGRLVEMQSVGRDITERKRLEGELTEARDKAQEASRSKTHFSRHDEPRNPHSR